MEAGKFLIIFAVADPGRGARGARYPLKKKRGKKKRDPYEDTDVEVDGRFKRAIENQKVKEHIGHGQVDR